jgi:hypothetical protein
LHRGKHSGHEALEQALNNVSLSGQWESWNDGGNFHTLIIYEMHPKGAAEHFSPLLICAGAAEGRSVHLSKVEIMGATEASFWWD